MLVTSPPRSGLGARTRRKLPAIAVLATLAVLALAPSALATNYQTYNDPTGDSGGAPDVTTVHVSNDPAGNLTFEITLANAPDLNAADVVIFIDADQNSATGEVEGNLGGIDNQIWAYQGRVAVCRWTGTECSPAVPQPSNSTYSYANGVLTFTVASPDVGVTSGFNFWIGTYVAPHVEGSFDPAPEFGLWNYQVVAGPPKLALGKLTLAKPAAGKLFKAGLTLTRQDSGAPVTSGNVVCKGAIAGLGAVKGTGSFVNGAATCAFKIPKTAKGKTIKGTITVGFLGATLKQSFSAKIK